MRNSEYVKFSDAKKIIAGRINEVALSVIMSPQRTLLGNQDEKVESLQLLNDRIAQFNEGVRAVAVAMQNRLEQEEAEDDD